MNTSRIIPLLPLLLTFGAYGQSDAGACPNAIDYVDPTYGGQLRELRRAEGHEHNLYYYRDPWNADNSYMVGVQSDLDQKNWRVVLYTGDGCFVKELFAIGQFDWKLAWDRRNPRILYTLKGNELYRFDVSTGKAEMLKSFAPKGMKPSGVSLNRAGDRILAITSDGVFRSYRLPDMGEERTFELNEACAVAADRTRLAWDKPHYIGYRNYIMVQCSKGVAVYDDTGALFHKFDGVGGGGHQDFSPDGKWAYFTLWGRDKPLEIHVVNLDGTNDRVLLSIPQSELTYLQNLHLSWPRHVNDWFIASFFPNARKLPAKYAPYLDEIVQIRLDGTKRFLARTGTAYSAAVPRSGGPQDMFWAQPLGRPSADGSRINFNSNRSGTIDQYILFLDRVKGKTAGPK